MKGFTLLAATALFASTSTWAGIGCNGGGPGPMVPAMAGPWAHPAMMWGPGPMAFGSPGIGPITASLAQASLRRMGPSIPPPMNPQMLAMGPGSISGHPIGASPHLLQAGVSRLGGPRMMAAGLSRIAGARIMAAGLGRMGGPRIGPPMGPQIQMAALGQFGPPRAVSRSMAGGQPGVRPASYARGISRFGGAPVMAAFGGPGMMGGPMGGPPMGPQFQQAVFGGPMMGGPLGYSGRWGGPGTGHPQIQRAALRGPFGGPGMMGGPMGGPPMGPQFQHAVFGGPMMGGPLGYSGRWGGPGMGHPQIQRAALRGPFGGPGMMGRPMGGPQLQRAALPRIGGRPSMMHAKTVQASMAGPAGSRTMLKSASLQRPGQPR
jgi:hypothetical protein